MGCGSSKQNEVSNPKKKSTGFHSFCIVDRIEDLKVTHSEMVGEKSGKINNDYSLLNPPLGKGNSYQYEL